MKMPKPVKYYKVTEDDLVQLLADSILAGAFRNFDPEQGSFQKQQKQYLKDMKASLGISKHKQVTYLTLARESLKLFEEVKENKNERPE